MTMSARNNYLVRTWVGDTSKDRLVSSLRMARKTVRDHLGVSKLTANFTGSSASTDDIELVWSELGSWTTNDDGYGLSATIYTK